MMASFLIQRKLLYNTCSITGCSSFTQHFQKFWLEKIWSETVDYFQRFFSFIVLNWTLETFLAISSFHQFSVSITLVSATVFCLFCPFWLYSYRYITMIGACSLRANGKPPMAPLTTVENSMNTSEPKLHIKWWTACTVLICLCDLLLAWQKYYRPFYTNTTGVKDKDVKET